jgi:hypothetical protein
MVIIPVVEKPRRRRSLELTVVPEDIFAKFADPRFAEDLRQNISSDFRKVRRRINQLELAYKVEKEWLARRLSKGLQSDHTAPTLFFPRFEILVQETDREVRRHNKQAKKAQKDTLGPSTTAPYVDSEASSTPGSTSTLLPSAEL